MFDQRGGRTKYAVLVEYLRDRIERDDLPGGTVPSESDLMRLSGYGRGVARKVIQRLQNEGLIVTDQGKRTRVRRPPPHREPLLMSPEAEAIVRMPTERERVERNMDFGVPVIEVHIDGRADLHSADGRVIRYKAPESK